jgi:hypothetical protein
MEPTTVPVTTEGGRGGGGGGEASSSGVRHGTGPQVLDTWRKQGRAPRWWLAEAKMDHGLWDWVTIDSGGSGEFMNLRWFLSICLGLEGIFFSCQEREKPFVPVVGQVGFQRLPAASCQGHGHHLPDTPPRMTPRRGGTPPRQHGKLPDVMFRDGVARLEHHQVTARP